MGPRIYPSYQDTNTTAKGSLLLTENEDIASIDVYVNNVLVAKEYSTVDLLYVVTINVGDVVRLESSNNFNIIPKRYDYTTDEENGDNGIKVTDFSIQYNLSSYTFTATTLQNGYNFEYHLDASGFFINLVYKYSGVTNPDNLYTIGSINQSVTVNNQQFSIPNYTYTSDTGFTYNLGSVLITGGTSNIFSTRSTLDPISGGNCIRWQSGFFGVYKDNFLIGAGQGQFPVTTPTCGASKIFIFDGDPIVLEQNGTYEVRRTDTSQNIAPTPTPSPTPSPTPTPVPPTPTPSPTPIPQIITSGLTSNLNYTPSSYPGTGTTWTNVGLSGSTYNATLVSSPTFTYGSPGYFDFDGTSQYATLSQAASGSTTGSYTLSAWVQVPSSSSTEYYIVRGELAYPPSNYSIRLGQSSNKFVANVFTTTLRAIIGTTTVNSSTWYNITLRWTSGTGLSLWVNGVKESELLTADTSLRTSTSVGWFLMKDEITNYAPGKLSNVAMYFRSLSDAEILSNFNTLKSIYGY